MYYVSSEQFLQYVIDECIDAGVFTTMKQLVFTRAEGQVRSDLHTIRFDSRHVINDIRYAEDHEWVRQ